MFRSEGWGFLKFAIIIALVVAAIWWLEGSIGKNYTVLAVGALVLVIIFAGGALFAQALQKQTLDAVSKFGAQDAQVDRYRLNSFKALASGQSAMQRAAAQLTVIDAKRVDKLAAQQAKLLTATPKSSEELWEFEEAETTEDEEFGSWE